MIKSPSGQNTIPLSKIWQTEMASLTHAFQKPLTCKERGQLNKLFPILGPNAEPVVRWALHHWSHFVWEVRIDKGVSLTPKVPVPGFLLAHADTAFNLMKAAHESQKKAKECAAKCAEEAALFPPPVVNSDPAPEVVKISPAEQLAILKGMGIEIDFADE